MKLNMLTLSHSSLLSVSMVPVGDFEIFAVQPVANNNVMSIRFSFISRWCVNIRKNHSTNKSGPTGILRRYSRDTAQGGWPGQP